MACTACLSEHEHDALCRTIIRPASPPAGSVAVAVATQPASAPAPADPLLGARLGSFRLVKKLGGGGMGAVYLGEQVFIGSKVAVKVLHPHLATHPQLVARFHAEALAVNLIGHENIVSIFDLAQAPTGQHYLVMEYLEGKPLSDLCVRPLDVRVAIPILIQVCNALEAAHRRGVVHRDLKPDNIFLTERAGVERFVKLLDFGIAKLLDTPRVAAQTSAGVLVGTPEYMSPEQYAGGDIDGRADLYALGVIAYQLATARLPFTGQSLSAVMLAHQSVPPPDPRAFNPALSEAYVRVIHRALAKAPADRFQNAAELKAALIEVLEQPARPARAPAASPVPSTPASTPASTRASTPAATPPAAQGVTYEGKAHSTAGQLLRRVRCQDLSRAGMFLAAEGFTPPLLSRLTVQVEVPGGALELPCEVVRHVSAAQSAAWNMPQGVGVQFIDLAPAARDALDRVLHGLPLLAPRPAQAAKDDAVVSAALALWRRRLTGDHYAVLGVAPDADFDELRVKHREARRELDALRARPISAEQRVQLDRALERLAVAAHTLSSPERRAEHDAAHANYRGVARCIAAGLTVSELERARARFLAENRRNESRARVFAASGDAQTRTGHSAAALESFEQALTLDPLNLSLHQRYWTLRRRTTPVQVRADR